MTTPQQIDSEKERVEADASRARIHRLRSTLGRTFVERQALIDLMCLAAVVREPLLFVGPPGTGKSALVRQFQAFLKIDEDAYFEYTLTRLTRTAEILGPWNVSRLHRGRHVRRQRGMLPNAKLALLNDVFQANSAVLNVLLRTMELPTVEAEHNDWPYFILFASARTVPEGGEAHHTLTDRFTLKAECLSVQDEHFDALINRGTRTEASPVLRTEPGTDCTLEDFQKVSRYVARWLQETNESNERNSFFPEETYREYQQLVKTLVRDDRIFVSDRKLVRMFRIIRARAWLFRDGVVMREDLGLLAYLGDTADELAILREKVPLLLGE